VVNPGIVAITGVFVCLVIVVVAVKGRPKLIKWAYVGFFSLTVIAVVIAFFQTPE